MHSAKNAVPDFGDIASLKEVFAEAKKRRKGRQPPYVMVVEDDPMTRRIVVGTFGEVYAMITAQNAQEAVANYLLHAPDAVFLDIGLPDIDGFAVLEQIMALDPEAFIVMFSSSDYPDNIAKALDAGAMGFIGKPFKKEHLLRYIQGSTIHHHKSLRPC